MSCDHKCIGAAADAFAVKVERLGIRKAAMEWAVAAVGAQPSTMSTHQIADRIQQVADRLFAYMTKDKPEVADSKPAKDWRDVPVTAGMLVEAAGPSAQDPMAQNHGTMRDRIEGLAVTKAKGNA